MKELRLVTRHTKPELLIVTVTEDDGNSVGIYLDGVCILKLYPTTQQEGAIGLTKISRAVRVLGDPCAVYRRAGILRRGKGGWVWSDE